MAGTHSSPLLWVHKILVGPLQGIKPTFSDMLSSRFALTPQCMFFCLSSQPDGTTRPYALSLAKSSSPDVRNGRLWCVHGCFYSGGFSLVQEGPLAFHIIHGVGRPFWMILGFFGAPSMRRTNKGAMQRMWLNKFLCNEEIMKYDPK